MGTRLLRPLKRFLAPMLAATLTAGWAGVEEGVSSAATGNERIEASEADTGDLVIRWVFRQGDLMSCRTSARDLRHVLFNHGERVQMIAIAIDSDPRYVQGFFRAERLRGEVEYLTERQFRRRHGSVPYPSVAIIRDNRVVELFAAGNLTLPGRRGTSELDGALSSLMGALAPAE